MKFRRTALGVGLMSLFCGAAAKAQEVAGPHACKAYFALAPADSGVLQLLSTPAVPPPRQVFAAQSTQKIKQWDLPQKVTAWSERPGAQDLARQWEELNRSWYGVKPGDTSKSVPAAVYRPYELLRVAPGDWKDLEKWIMKEAAKQAPGLCYDQHKATYVFLTGALRDLTAGGGAGDATRTAQYSQYAGATQGEGIGPGAHSTSGTGHISVADEFSGANGSRDPSVFACAYLYRTEGTAEGGGGMRRAVPDYYYCHPASTLRSSLTTMLKYLSKQGML
jgi:hypothetical protein